ncbi:uncharacterized protein [Panulirus ornatus]|uniref:uncharacterized protein n=1 Tax=Panulirus ornatus TaxID=150431 RepID=UPI003A8BD585
MTSTPSFTAVILRLLIIQGVSLAIRITRLEVPASLAVGEGGWLVCEWADEGDHVYSLKWYFGIYEFYRWTPLETPSVRIFPVPYFDVDPQQSHRGRVLIHNLTEAAGGNYRCEVSGEAPVFKTSSDSALLIVVDLPDEQPRIIEDGVGPCRLQQLITVSCTSHGARPAPNLTFYINDESVDPTWDSRELVFVNETSGLETAVKSLQFPLRLTMVQLDGLQVKCVASIPEMYWLSSETTLSVELPHNYSHLFGSQGSVSYSSSQKTATHTPLLSTLVFLASRLLW